MTVDNFSLGGHKPLVVRLDEGRAGRLQVPQQDMNRVVQIDSFDGEGEVVEYWVLIRGAVRLSEELSSSCGFQGF